MRGAPKNGDPELYEKGQNPPVIPNSDPAEKDLRI